MSLRLVSDAQCTVISPIYYCLLYGLLINLFSFLTEILQSPHWQQMFHFKHPAITKVLPLLPSVVASSREANTIRVYMSAVKRFEKWATPIPDMPVFPTTDVTVAVYLLSLVQLGKSAATIDQFICATSWMHRMAGYDPPTNSNIVRTVREGAKRITSRPATPKEPMTPEILQKLLISARDEQGHLSLYNLRMMAFTLMCYTAFLRFDEAAHIRREDIAFHGSYFALFIQRSKTDTYREGRTVLVAKTGTELDPYVMLLKYLDSAKIKPNDSCFIFRNVIHFKCTNTHMLSPKDKPLSYSRARELLLQQLAKVVPNPSVFGLHSLRAGGATQAANSGLNDRLFKRHGRWRSENAKDRYIKDSINRRLQVTLNLGVWLPPSTSTLRHHAFVLCTFLTSFPLAEQFHTILSL